MLKGLFRLAIGLACVLPALVAAQQTSSLPVEAERAAQDIYEKANEALGASSPSDKPFTQTNITHWIVLYNSAQTATKPPYRELALRTVEGVLSRLAKDEEAVKAPAQNGHRFSFFPYQNRAYFTLPPGANGAVLEHVAISDALARIKDAIPMSPIADERGHQHEKALRELVERPIEPRLGTRVIVMLTDLQGSDPVSDQSFNEVLGEAYRQDGSLPVYRGTSEQLGVPQDMTVRIFTQNDPTPIPLPQARSEPQPQTQRGTPSSNLGWIWAVLFVGATAGGVAYYFSGKVTISIGDHYSHQLHRGRSIEIYGPGAKKGAPNTYVLTALEGLNADGVKLATIRFGSAPVLQPTSGYSPESSRGIVTLKRGSDNRVVLKKGQKTTGTLRVKVSR